MLTASAAEVKLVGLGEATKYMEGLVQVSAYVSVIFLV
jgi:hypothetical protein